MCGSEHDGGEYSGIMVGMTVAEVVGRVIKR